VTIFFNNNNKLHITLIKSVVNMATNEFEQVMYKKWVIVDNRLV